MAKKSKAVREKKLWAAAPSKARQQLKATIASAESTPDEVFEASIKLQKRPRNESMSRKVRRCLLCARPKGVYRFFGLCRCCLRKYMV